MAKFTSRTKAPDKSSKYYINYKNGGYNTSIVIDDGSVIYQTGNCVGYAQGRLLECQAIKKVDWKLPACNAEDWYDTAKKNGLSVGATPKLGAVICWKSGKVKNKADGCGHVAVVEAIAADGTITVSESGYKSYLFKTEKIKKPYARTGNELLGFIYPYTDFGTGDLNKETKVVESTKKELTVSSYKDYTDGGVYRVRRSFKDAASSVGSYAVWRNAFNKWNSVKANGYHVYDMKGNQLD